MLQEEQLEYYNETKGAIDNLMRFEKYTDAFHIAEACFEIFIDGDILSESEKVYICEVLVKAYLARRSVFQEKSHHIAFQAALYLVKKNPDEQNFLNLGIVAKIFYNSLRSKRSYTKQLEILLNEIVFAVFSHRAIKGYDVGTALSYVLIANVTIDRLYRRTRNKDAVMRQKISNIQFLIDYNMEKSRRSIAKGSVEIAEYFANKKCNEFATAYYLLAIEMLSEIYHDSEDVLIEFEKVCEKTAKYFYSVGEYEKSLELSTLLAKLIEAGLEEGLENEWFLAMTYDFMKILCRTMERHDESKIWHEKAVEAAQKYSDPNDEYNHVYLLVSLA